MICNILPLSRTSCPCTPATAFWNNAKPLFRTEPLGLSSLIFCKDMLRNPEAAPRNMPRGPVQRLSVPRSSHMVLPAKEAGLGVD